MTAPGQPAALVLLPFIAGGGVWVTVDDVVAAATAAGVEVRDEHVLSLRALRRLGLTIENRRDGTVTRTPMGTRYAARREGTCGHA